MPALIETLDPLDQFESLAARLMAILAFKLATLTSSLTGNWRQQCGQLDYCKAYSNDHYVLVIL